MREITPWTLLALTINCVVGAGVLGLPGRVFALAGPATPWVLVAAGVLAAAVALCLAELAGRFDGPGGPALYLDRAFGALAGYSAGWLLWSATVLGAASLLDLFADLLNPGGVTGKLFMVLTTAAAMTGLTLSGARRSAIGSAVLTVLKLALLAALALAGLVGPAAPARLPLAAPRAADALLLVFFAFVGFERPTAVAAEVRDARRTVPIALIGAMATVALLYGAVFAACLRDLPALASSGQPVVDLAVRSFGRRVASALNLGAALIVLGTLLSQWITAPRLLLALAEQGRLPAALARVSSHRNTPDLAILATGVSAVGLALTGGFAGAAAASSAARLLLFAGCGAAMLRLRSRDNGPAPRFRLPGGGWVAAAVILSCLALLSAALRELVHLFIVVAIGGLLWLWTAWRRRRT